MHPVAAMDPLLPENFARCTQTHTHSHSHHVAALTAGTSAPSRASTCGTTARVCSPAGSWTRPSCSSPTALPPQMRVLVSAVAAPPPPPQEEELPTCPVWPQQLAVAPEPPPPWLEEDHPPPPLSQAERLQAAGVLSLQPIPEAGPVCTALRSGRGRPRPGLAPRRRTSGTTPRWRLPSSGKPHPGTGGRIVGLCRAGFRHEGCCIVDTHK